jgi:hypothetical protein
MNESYHAGAPPATSDMIDALPRKEIHIEADTVGIGECCISQEAFEIGDIVISLPCGHHNYNYKEEPDARAGIVAFESPSTVIIIIFDYGLGTKCEG